MEWFIKFDRNKNKIISNIFEIKNSTIPEFFIDGFIVPRQNDIGIYDNYNGILLLKELYAEFGDEFIHHVKGIFVIVIFKDGSITLYTDRHSIKKAYIYSDDECYIISGRLNKIAESHSVAIDKDRAALFMILSHNLPGLTFFKNISTSFPAGCVKISKDGIHDTIYWHPKKIIDNRAKNKCRVSEFAEWWKKLLYNYISYLKPNNVGITLTGGNDSRMVFSALHALGVLDDAFSFGNPDSGDGIIAKLVASKTKVNYRNYFVETPTKVWFKQTSNSILEYGNSLINIHRAHRHDALAKAAKNSNNSMLFTGLVGGEYLKETFYDNNSIPDLFEKWQIVSKEEKEQLLIDELTSKGVLIDSVNLSHIEMYINQFLKNADGYMAKEKKFIYTYLFYGCTHHSQDSYVFNMHFKYVINPFMDIDFLEKVSETIHWHLNRSQNLIEKLFHSRYWVSITYYLAKEVGDIKYSKKGAYSPKELAKYPLIYALRRVIRMLLGEKHNYPSNFSMGNWLKDFSNEQLNEMPEEIKTFVDVPKLIEIIRNLENKKPERSWHIVTNPINIKINFEYYNG